MVDRHIDALFAHPNGSGPSFSNISGSITTKEVANLAHVGFDDNISSFLWDTVVPVKEVIEPLHVTATSLPNPGALSRTLRGANKYPLSQTHTISLNNSTSPTITVSTEDQLITGISSTLTVSDTMEAGVLGLVWNETTTSWSVTVNFQYTHTTTRTISMTKMVDLNIQQQV